MKTSKLKSSLQHHNCLLSPLTLMRKCERECVPWLAWQHQCQTLSGKSTTLRVCARVRVRVFVCALHWSIYMTASQLSLSVFNAIPLLLAFFIFSLVFQAPGTLILAFAQFGKWLQGLTIHCQHAPPQSITLSHVTALHWLKLIFLIPPKNCCLTASFCSPLPSKLKALPYPSTLHPPSFPVLAQKTPPWHIFGCPNDQNILGSSECCIIWVQVKFGTRCDTPEFWASDGWLIQLSCCNKMRSCWLYSDTGVVSMHTHIHTCPRACMKEVQQSSECYRETAVSTIIHFSSILIH